MALDTEWKLQGATATVVETTDSIQFSGGTFDTPIMVGSYNGGTHVRSSGGSDDSSANSPKNSKYLTSTTVDVGGGSVSLSSVPTTSCPFKITVSYDSNITLSDVKMFAYNGTTEATAPTNLDVYLAEQGNTTWTNADGSANALTLNDKTTPATSHDFYVLMSVKPTAVGTQNANKVKFQFTYQ